MRVSALILTAIVLPLAAEAEVVVRLSAAAGAGRPAGEGFLPARLTIEDPNAELGGVVAAVSLRRSRGGPTVMYALSLAAGAKQTLLVHLPAVSLQQTYQVRLLADGDGAGTPLKELEVPITWQQVDAPERCRKALVDEILYDDWREDLPRWDGRLLRLVFLAAALGCVGLGGALLIRKTVLRLAAVLVMTAAATCAVTAAASRQRTLDVFRTDELVVLTCRRTETWVHTGGALTPVYRSQGQMDEDNLVYRPGRSLRVTIRPEEVRLFRRLRGGGPSTRGR